MVELTNHNFRVKYRLHAEVAEQADALRSGRSSLYGSVGSTPTFGTHPLEIDPGDDLFLATSLYWRLGG